MSNAKVVSPATPAPAPVFTVALVPNAVAKFRTGTARALWFAAVAKHAGSPLPVYVKAVTTSPPSLPQRGKSAGKLESPEGWVAYFVKQGLVTVVPHVGK
jgi:hypothetical protein